MFSILQSKEGQQIGTTYEVTETGVNIKNVKGDTLMAIPVMGMIKESPNLSLSTNNLTIYRNSQGNDRPVTISKLGNGAITTSAPVTLTTDDISCIVDGNNLYFYGQTDTGKSYTKNITVYLASYSIYDSDSQVIAVTYQDNDI